MKSDFLFGSFCCVSFTSLSIVIRIYCGAIIRRERVMASGGKVGRLGMVGGAEVGFSLI